MPEEIFWNNIEIEAAINTTLSKEFLGAWWKEGSTTNQKDVNFYSFLFYLNHIESYESFQEEQYILNSVLCSCTFSTKLP
jgi:hypothetical protein